MAETTLVNMRGTDRWDRRNLVKIDRSSVFGNPFIIDLDGDRDRVIELYQEWFYERLKMPWFASAVERLAGKKLGCWCAPERCHGEVIITYLKTLEG